MPLAPRGCIRALHVCTLKHGIVGIEVEITRIEGGWKVSQEREHGDWQGVVSGFKGLGTKEGDEMARMIEERESLVLVSVARWHGRGRRECYRIASGFKQHDFNFHAGMSHPRCPMSMNEPLARVSLRIPQGPQVLVDQLTNPPRSPPPEYGDSPR